MDSRRAFNGANAKGTPPPERAAFLISISSSAYAIANFVFSTIAPRASFAC
jgi:hypothetical protein